ncbi:hypothetical protein SAMN05216236_11454 [Sedimentitalea nanhaiensis]|uniref:Uncharacterized protein n=1 Tax=Sedimentitalea nanhaiensis TaxID=999627 RepID=A0A1I7C4J0_9RHOB|nr:hypothetical protein SAMN05216236_11454 [Sedimentitalea nanhaiensis]
MRGADETSGPLPLPLVPPWRRGPICALEAPGVAKG